MKHIFKYKLLQHKPSSHKLPQMWISKAKIEMDIMVADSEKLIPRISCFL